MRLRKNRYRIVTDNFGGYQAQVKFWWLPLVWFPMHQKGSTCNSFYILEDVEKFIKKKVATGTVIKEVKVDE